MRWGFKTWCENVAISYRKELNKKETDPLTYELLSKHLNISLITPDVIKTLSAECLNILLYKESSSWSAVTISKNNKHIIIYNPSHSLPRRSNDVTHELSHIILEHKPQIMHSYETGIFLRNYDRNQEEEADWLAGTLLLPKSILMNIKFMNIPLDNAAKKYNVSISLLKMRLNLTGVNKIRLQ